MRKHRSTEPITPPEGLTLAEQIEWAHLEHRTGQAEWLRGVRTMRAEARQARKDAARQSAVSHSGRHA